MPLLNDISFVDTHTYTVGSTIELSEWSPKQSGHIDVPATCVQVLYSVNLSRVL